MVTAREKFLMLEWGKVIQFYKDSLCDDVGKIDEWLNTVVDDAGHTVEQHLSHDADKL